MHERDGVAHQVQGQHGQDIGQVVAVDQIGLEVVEDGLQRVGGLGVLTEVPPPVEELVA